VTVQSTLDPRLGSAPNIGPDGPNGPGQLSAKAAIVEGHWREMHSRKRLYTWGGIIAMVVAMGASLWFAN